MEGTDKATEMKVQRLEEKIRVSTEKSGIEVDKELHDDLTQIMMERTSEVQKKCGSECFQSIFWEQQLQALKEKNNNKNSIQVASYDDQMDTSTCSLLLPIMTCSLQGFSSCHSSVCSATILDG